MSKHTSELWHHSDCIIYAEDQLGTDEYVAKAETIADARRIVACVNACKGISTETLERVDLPLNAIVLMSQQARLIREREEAMRWKDRIISDQEAENDLLRAKLADAEKLLSTQHSIMLSDEQRGIAK